MSGQALVFTQPLWLALISAGGAAFLLVLGLRGQANPGHLAGVAALAAVTANLLSAYVQFDETGASSRSMFMTERLAWRDIVSADVVERRGKYAPSTALELRGAGGSHVSLVLNDLKPAQGAALSNLLSRKLPPALAAKAQDVAQRTARQRG